MNILVWVISLFIGIVVGMIGFFFLLLALNGFSASVANYGIYTYLIWSILTTLIAATISGFLISYLQKTSLNKVLAVILALICSIVLTVGSDFVGIIVSSMVASEFQTNNKRK